MQANTGAEGPIIEIRGLSKAYTGPDGGTFNALTDVNLTVERGIFWHHRHERRRKDHPCPLHEYA